MRLRKRLAIIGAGEAAKPYLDSAKVKGVHTVCFGQYADSLYREDCDTFVDVSIFDVDRITESCKALQIDGIVPSSEISTEVAAQVAHRLHLRGNSVIGGFAARNKYIMRQRVAKLSSVRQPRFSLLEEAQDFPLPAIIKAPDSCGKRGITLVQTRSEWNAAVTYAKQYSSNGQVLVEEYIAGGQEYSVECLSSDNHHQIIQITQKDSSGPPHFIELGHHQPAHLEDTERFLLERATHDILTVLGIHNGLSHLELKFKNGDIFFVEIGARGGGDRIADTLVGLSTDFDYFGAAIDVALGQYTYRPAYSRCHAGIYFLCKQSEALLPLFKAAGSAEWCREYSLKNTTLQTVTTNGGDMSGYFIYSADHKITMKDAIHTVIRINDLDNAFDLLYRHNLEIGRNLSESELVSGIRKFLEHGNVFGIVIENRIIAMLNVYCNNYQTREAYINNVYVLPEHRGNHLAFHLMQHAIRFCRECNFNSIRLHVAEDNVAAVTTYRKLGFVFTDNTNEVNREMVFSF